VEIQSDICEICGDNLIAFESPSSTKLLECFYCHKQFEAMIACKRGHYICDNCHSKQAKEIMLDYCFKTEEKNPFTVADTLLKHPSFNMYGPEHHILVPLVLLTMIKSLGLVNHVGNPVTPESFQKALNRASKIPGGWCGFYGSCGAGMGAGVAISVFTNANPSKALERTYATKTVSTSLLRIADGLEHCCKRSVKIGIEEGIKMIAEITHQKLEFSPDICPFRVINDRCAGIECAFF
jgi:hypothetical protein